MGRTPKGTGWTTTPTSPPGTEHAPHGQAGPPACSCHSSSLPAPPAPAAVETKHKHVQTAECMVLGFFDFLPRARLVRRPVGGVGRLRTEDQAPGPGVSRAGQAGLRGMDAHSAPAFTSEPARKAGGPTSSCS